MGYRSYKKQSSVWLHETYAQKLQSSSSSLSSLSSSSSWKRFNRRRRHSSPILLLSNKFAIKWRLCRSAVEATSAAVAKNGGSDSYLIGCLLFSKKMKVVCGRFLLLLKKKTNTLNTKRIIYYSLPK